MQMLMELSFTLAKRKFAIITGDHAGKGNTPSKRTMQVDDSESPASKRRRNGDQITA